MKKELTLIILLFFSPFFSEAQTTADTPLFTIPVVVHVLHDNGIGLVPDTSIYNLIDKINTYFLKTTPDTALIINKFKPIAANTRIRFKLANIDPYGNPTKGIDHIYSYQASNLVWDQTKINQWPRDRYLNVWMINFNSTTYGLSVFAEGYPFSSAETHSYLDGVLFNNKTLTDYVDLANGFGFYLGLVSPCGYSWCSDADLVSDTPPCDLDSIWTYPINYFDTSCGDTANAQNIMINPNPAIKRMMFTKGQAAYMQFILGQDINNRDSLVSKANFTKTGMNMQMADLPPVADFALSKTTYNLYNTALDNYFGCTSTSFYFIDESWNDTVSSLQWHFSNSPDTISSSSKVVKNKFGRSGWVSVSLTANSNAGTNMIKNDSAVYVAKDTAIDPIGYIEEFDPSADLNQWPIFNYFHNNFKWEFVSGVGYFDSYCIRYTGFDNRPFPTNQTGGPGGDIDDLYSPSFDLSSFTLNCNLNFVYAGAYNKPTIKGNDTLEIDCSTNCGGSWYLLKTIAKDSIRSNAVTTGAYTPAGLGDWKHVSIEIPFGVRANKVFFRFRYKPGADQYGNSTGNNFYLDRISISDNPLGVPALSKTQTYELYPNPCSGIVNINSNEEGALSLYSIEGVQVGHYMISKGINTIPVSQNMSPGMYLCRFISLDGSLAPMQRLIYQP